MPKIYVVHSVPASKQRNPQVHSEHTSNQSCKTGAKYSNDIHSALWPPEQHQPGTGGPVALWPCSYSCMFPRQMPRQTLHINRNLLWGLFSPPTPALVPPAYQNTIARLHTNTTRGDLVEEDIFWLRNKRPQLRYKMTNLLCLAKIIWRLKENVPFLNVTVVRSNPPNAVACFDDMSHALQ